MKATSIKHVVICVVLFLTATESVMGQAITNSALLKSMKLVKKQPTPELVSPESRKIALSETNKLTRKSGQLEVVVHGYEFHGNFRGSSDKVLRFWEFQIKSENDKLFNWSCYEWTMAHPHDFKLFTATSTTFGSYASSDGVKVFRIDAGNSSENALELMLERQPILGEIPLLGVGELQTKVGREPFRGENALYWTINVDNISEESGELRVTLHGANPQPQFTFALRNSSWELVKN